MSSPETLTLGFCLPRQSSFHITRWFTHPQGHIFPCRAVIRMQKYLLTTVLLYCPPSWGVTLFFPGPVKRVKRTAYPSLHLHCSLSPPQVDGFGKGMTTGHRLPQGARQTQTKKNGQASPSLPWAHDKGKSWKILPPSLGTEHQLWIIR